MRRFIFTDRERGLLEAWLTEGVENQQTRIVLSWVRRNWISLEEDMTLLFKVVRKLQDQQRWWGRVTGRSEFGSALRRAESALTRARRGATTSAVSRS
jgi:hypothetical protein